MNESCADPLALVTSDPERDRLLTVDTAVDYAVERDLLPSADGATAEVLVGGVSSVVIAISRQGRELVVKQALPRLRVAAEWTATRERAMVEAAALELAAELGQVPAPRVIDVDRRRLTFTMERAPAGWANWKAELLAGRADVRIAAGLGAAVGRLHAATAGRELSPQLTREDTFEQLRLTPYYREVAARNEELRGLLDELIDATKATRACLVHGDLSPKNVLVGDGAFWLVDWEVAHVGDPSFDVAFLLSHLALKAIRAPSAAASLDRCATAFRGAYATQGPPEAAASRAVAHLGALLIARTDGASPVEYLTTQQQDAARRAGRALLDGGSADLDGAWRLVLGASGR